MTRVDFKALDRLSLQPIGIYGPKNELASFLVSVGVLRQDACVSRCMSRLLLNLWHLLQAAKNCQRQSPCWSQFGSLSRQDFSSFCICCLLA